MRVFTISEALVYLNTILPGVAPKNEETLRRAIRSGELKAEVSLGRAGSRIKEEDLLEYCKKYTRNGLLTPRNESVLMKIVLQDKNLVGIPSLLELVTSFGERCETDKINYKIKLLESRNLWNERRIVIQKNIDQLQIELQKCQDEMKAFDIEISKN